MGGQITHEVDAMCIMDACWCSYNQVSLTPFELLHSQAEIQSDCQTKPAVFYMHLSRVEQNILRCVIYLCQKDYKVLNFF